MIPKYQQYLYEYIKGFHLNFLKLEYLQLDVMVVTIQFVVLWLLLNGIFMNIFNLIGLILKGAWFKSSNLEKMFKIFVLVKQDKQCKEIH